MQEKKIAVILSCVIGLLLLASVVFYIILQRTADISDDAYYVQIMQDGKCIEKIDLSKVKEPYEMTVETDSGGYNIIEIRPDGVGIVEADCPDKLCQKQGFIKNGSEAIVCLPNRLVIEFEKKEASDEEFDAVVE